MDYNTIDEIYSANDQVRDRLLKTIASISDAELKALPEDEKWSIEQIFEHVAMVDEGMAKICRKLLTEAEKDNLKSSVVAISDVFRTYADGVAEMKLEAPERVQPTGQQSVEGSKEKLDASQALFDSLRPQFHEFDGVNLKFPHPYFGPLSAQDWLVLAGKHAHRHTRQIEKLAEKIRR
jgi:hypothetical protein